MRTIQDIHVFKNSLNASKIRLFSTKIWWLRKPCPKKSRDSILLCWRMLSIKTKRIAVYIHCDQAQVGSLARLLGGKAKLVPQSWILARESAVRFSVALRLAPPTISRVSSTYTIVPHPWRDITSIPSKRVYLCVRVLQNWTKDRALWPSGQWFLNSYVSILQINIAIAKVIPNYSLKVTLGETLTWTKWQATIHYQTCRRCTEKFRGLIYFTQFNTADITSVANTP